MTKTKKSKTLTELREAWTRGGLIRAANLTKAERLKIALQGGKARKAQFEAQKNAKARELEAMHHETHSPVFSASAQG